MNLKPEELYALIGAHGRFFVDVEKMSADQSRDFGAATRKDRLVERAERLLQTVKELP